MPRRSAALISKGANVNARNDAQATPLMWAASDLDKTRVLLDAGAQVNAKSSDNRTPLMIAATKPGNVATVRLLLDRGADANPTAHPGGESSPLTQAATAGDARDDADHHRARRQRVGIGGTGAVDVDPESLREMRQPADRDDDRQGRLHAGAPRDGVSRRCDHGGHAARPRCRRQRRGPDRPHAADVCGGLGSALPRRRPVAHRARRRRQRDRQTRPGRR